MKIVTISDTHQKHINLKIPDGDMLIVAGDITEGIYFLGADRFNAWLGTLPHKYKIVIAGNHDFYFQDQPDRVKEILSNAIYLNESGITIEGIKIWGSPWTKWFYDWAFNIPIGTDADYWKKVPDDTDILITHGPPYGILDTTKLRNEPAGCKELLKTVERIKPKLHVFGHIHESYGTYTNKETTFINTSICNEKYEPINKPIVYEYRL